MKVCAGVIFYNEQAGLKRLLDTTLEFDKVYCIDGRFTMMGKEGDSDISTDDSHKVVKSYENTELHINGVTNEPTKRNKYIELAVRDKMDAIVVVDCDEWLVDKNWPLFIEQLSELEKPSIYRMPGYNMWTFESQPRVIFRPEEFEYTKSHCAFLHKPTGYYGNHGNFNTRIIKGFRIASNDGCRSPEHYTELEKYQNKLLMYEYSLTDIEMPNNNTFKDNLAVSNQMAPRYCLSCEAPKDNFKLSYNVADEQNWKLTHYFVNDKGEVLTVDCQYVTEDKRLQEKQTAKLSKKFKQELE